MTGQITVEQALAAIEDVYVLTADEREELTRALKERAEKRRDEGIAPYAESEAECPLPVAEGAGE